MNCCECRVPITQSSEPLGVIYIRKKDEYGHYQTAAICTPCYSDRPCGDFIPEPHRVLWEAPL